MPRKGDVAASAPDQAKDTQITLGGSGEDLPTTSDASGEAKRIAQTSAPDTQEANKFVPSGNEALSSMECGQTVLFFYIKKVVHIIVTFNTLNINSIATNSFVSCISFHFILFYRTNFTC
jgi:hypothetical protein